MLCQREEREAGRAYPRTCPTCKLGPCQKFGAKPLQSLSEAQAEIARLTAALEAGQRNNRETFDAMCAMRNAINEHIPMPSLESDLLHGPENSVFCATVAEVVVSHIDKLTAELAALRADQDALVAAAYEAAVQEIDCGCQDGVCRWAHACPKSGVEAILALTPSDATAALDAKLRVERNKALREVAEAVKELCPHADIPGGNCIPDKFDEGTSAAYETILAMIETEGK